MATRRFSPPGGAMFKKTICWLQVRNLRVKIYHPANFQQNRSYKVFETLGSSLSNENSTCCKYDLELGFEKSVFERDLSFGLWVLSFGLGVSCVSSSWCRKSNLSLKFEKCTTAFCRHRRKLLSQLQFAIVIWEICHFLHTCHKVLSQM